MGRTPPNGVIHFLDTLQREVRDLAPKPGQCFKYAVEDFEAYDGTTALRILIGDLRAAVKNFKLSECQSVCLATCASANLIEYKMNWSVFAATAENNVQTGEGVCREYSTVARLLIEIMGIKAHEATKMFRGHEFVKVHLNGHSYSVEPQSPFWEFYPSTFL